MASILVEICATQIRLEKRIADWKLSNFSSFSTSNIFDGHEGRYPIIRFIAITFFNLPDQDV